MNTYLDTKRTSEAPGSSGLVSKVKSLLEQPSDVTAFSSKPKADINDLISFDINKIKGGSMAFQNDMDKERDKQLAKVTAMTAQLKEIEKHTAIAQRMIKRHKNYKRF